MRLKKWQMFEPYLLDFDILGTTFDNKQIAKVMGITPAGASSFIDAYLDAQRAKNSRTRYVIHREGRTNSAVWKVGQRSVDAKEIGSEFFSDVSVKFRGAVAPDLQRLAMINPRVAKKCEAIVDAVAENALNLLMIAVGGEISELEAV